MNGSRNGTLERISCGTTGLGCAQLGNLGQEMTDAEAVDLLEAAWEAGVRYFDVAPHYGLGLAERRLGAFLQEKPRDQFVLSTKVGRLLVPNPQGTGQMDDGFAVPATLRRQWDFSGAGVRRSLEESLERLGLDTIDIALIHDPGERTNQAIAEAVPALTELREAGVLAAIGVGTRDTDALTRFVRESAIDAVLLAGGFTLLVQDALETLFPACAGNGVSVINAGVFNSGILAVDTIDSHSRFEYAGAEAVIVERATRCADICASHDVPLRHAAYLYSTSDSNVVTALLGADTAQQARSNASLPTVTAPDSLWSDLRANGIIP